MRPTHPLRATASPRGRFFFATFEHGVLTIVAPKAETVKPKTIKVTAR